MKNVDEAVFLKQLKGLENCESMLFCVGNNKLGL